MTASFPFCGKCGDTGFVDGINPALLSGTDSSRPYQGFGLDRYPNARFSAFKDDYFSSPQMKMR
jgi:hypothetical protein